MNKNIIIIILSCLLAIFISLSTYLLIDKHVISNNNEMICELDEEYGKESEHPYSNLNTKVILKYNRIGELTAEKFVKKFTYFRESEYNAIKDTYTKEKADVTYDDKTMNVTLRYDVEIGSDIPSKLYLGYKEFFEGQGYTCKTK